MKNILSLFDGMSGAQIALERCGIPYIRYFSSEIDKYAIAVAQYNYPKTRQLGDVTQITGISIPHIDLLIGGSPCQGFSFVGKQLNFADPRSALFFEYIRLKNECNPDYFLLENVKMKQEFRDIISESIGVEPIEINSALVSAQNRKRLYWTNIPNITQPKDKGMLLKDIVFSDDLSTAKKSVITFTERRTEKAKQIRKESLKIGKDYWPRREKEIIPRTDGKANCLTSNPTIENLILSDKELIYMDRKVKGTSRHWRHSHDIRKDKSRCIVANLCKGVPYNVFKDLGCIRKLHPIECERLQTLPNDYTLVPWGKRMTSNTQRYKMIGNGFTIDVIAHILNHIPN